MRKSIYLIILLLILSLSVHASAESKSFLFQPYNSNFYVYGYGESSFIINQSKLTELKLDRRISELSTGKRINSASDDPAGYAVAAKMDSLLKQLRQESVNEEDLRNMHNYIESAIAQDQELLQRIRLLIVQASGGILNNEDRGYIQSEINQFLNQIDMNAGFLQFNSKTIIPDLTVKNLSLDKIDVVHKPDTSLGIVDHAITILTKKRVSQGVRSNILNFQIEGKSYQYLNLQRTESNISDSDMSEGITELIRNSILLKSQHGLIIRSR